MTCSHCDGRGEVAGTMPDGSWQTDPCPYCSGSGGRAEQLFRERHGPNAIPPGVPEAPKRKRGRQSLNAYKRGLTP